MAEPKTFQPCGGTLPEDVPTAEEATPENLQRRKLRSYELGELARRGKRIDNICAALLAVIMTVVGGALAYTTKKRYDFFNDLAVAEKVTPPNCEAIISAVRRAAITQADLQSMCCNNQFSARVTECLREAGIYSR